ncbi:hypothetical protein ACFLRY_00395 [Bacteroidota bacterium]
MKKAICIFRDDTERNYEVFQSMIKETTAKILDVINPVKLSYTLSFEKAPLISIIPFRKSLISIISIYYNDEVSLDFLKNFKGFSGCYSVTEALPVAYEKDWENGESTPGICLLTLFRQKKSIDYDTFLDRWHNGHTPLSLDLHPLWHYNRNVVDEAIVSGPQWYDGIVEEHCKSRSELMNPFKFFGNGIRIIPNMIKVYRDVNSFIDYGSIETYLVREYHIT